MAPKMCDCSVIFALPFDSTHLFDAKTPTILNLKHARARGLIGAALVRALARGALFVLTFYFV
jgi:hypothetical protein